MEMHNLYFTRAVSANAGDIVFLFTAKDALAAKDLCMSRISPAYAHLFRVACVEFICLTPNEVDGFEPC